MAISQQQSGPQDIYYSVVQGTKVDTPVTSMDRHASGHQALRLAVISLPMGMVVTALHSYRPVYSQPNLSL
jgi:hypothetical protein